MLRNDDSFVPQQTIAMVSGMGGSGKSRVIHACRDLLMRHDKIDALKIVSFVGAAAIKVGGTTIHSFLGLVRILLN